MNFKYKKLIITFLLTIAINLFNGDQQNQNLFKSNLLNKVLENKVLENNNIDQNLLINNEDVKNNKKLIIKNFNQKSNYSWKKPVNSAFNFLFTNSYKYQEENNKFKLKYKKRSLAFAAALSLTLLYALNNNLINSLFKRRRMGHISWKYILNNVIIKNSIQSIKNNFKNPYFYIPGKNIIGISIYLSLISILSNCKIKNNLNELIIHNFIGNDGLLEPLNINKKNFADLQNSIKTEEDFEYITQENFLEKYEDIKQNVEDKIQQLEFEINILRVKKEELNQEKNEKTEILEKKIILLNEELENLKKIGKLFEIVTLKKLEELSKFKEVYKNNLNKLQLELDKLNRNDDNLNQNEDDLNQNKDNLDIQNKEYEISVLNFNYKNNLKTKIEEIYKEKNQEDIKFKIQYNEDYKKVIVEALIKLYNVHIESFSQEQKGLIEDLTIDQFYESIKSCKIEKDQNQQNEAISTIKLPDNYNEEKKNKINTNKDLLSKLYNLKNNIDNKLKNSYDNFRKLPQEVRYDISEIGFKKFKKLKYNDLVVKFYKESIDFYNDLFKELNQTEFQKLNNYLPWLTLTASLAGGLGYLGYQNKNSLINGLNNIWNKNKNIAKKYILEGSKFVNSNGKKLIKFAKNNQFISGAFASLFPAVIGAKIYANKKNNEINRLKKDNENKNKIDKAIIEHISNYKINELSEQNIKKENEINQLKEKENQLRVSAEKQLELNNDLIQQQKSNGQEKLLLENQLKNLQFNLQFINTEKDLINTKLQEEKNKLNLSNQELISQIDELNNNLLNNNYKNLLDEMQKIKKEKDLLIMELKTKDEIFLKEINEEREKKNEKKIN